MFGFVTNISSEKMAVGCPIKRNTKNAGKRWRIYTRERSLQKYEYIPLKRNAGFFRKLPDCF
ncbi:MAG: hypothetical protein DBX46_00745 [Clostridiales bacterium]|nr:MAG: hypothetical protein DBX46_00745 [Clostridiales bacterium]